MSALELPVRVKPLFIEDYALIGDCKTAALVGKDGAIDWLCLPRFDSPACFAGILGTQDNGSWVICPAEPGSKIRRFYHENTLVLETLFNSEQGEVAVIDCMPLDQECSHIIRRVEGRSGTVKMRLEIKIRFNYGSSTPWVTQDPDEMGIIAIVGPDLIALRSPVKLQGRGHSTVAQFEVKAGEHFTFVLSHGHSHLKPPSALDGDTALRETASKWRAWSDRCIYDGPYKAQVIRSLITLKALTYAPTGGIVAAPTTSLPEQLGGQRNWDYRFCWLRDATLTLTALMASGYYEEAQQWRDWLQRSIAGDAEEMQIMYGVAGERNLLEWEISWLPGYEDSAPVRCGNAATGQLQLDVYGEVMDALHQARATGLDVPESAWSLQVRMVQHLETIWQLPDDGIWEVRGVSRHFVHSKVMAWVAFDRAVQDIEKYGLPGPLERWRVVRDAIHADVCAKGFNHQKNSFTQSYEVETLDASLLLIPIVGFLAWDDVRVQNTIEAVEKELDVGGFLLRYKMEEDGLPPGEGAFLPCSFWLADNYAQQGRHVEAQELFERLLLLCNDVGLLAEEYEPALKRQVGNFPQAFSHLSIVNTAFSLRSYQAAIQRSEGAQPASTEVAPFP